MESGKNLVKSGKDEKTRTTRSTCLNTTAPAPTYPHLNESKNQRTPIHPERDDRRPNKGPDFPPRLLDKNLGNHFTTPSPSPPRKADPKRDRHRARTSGGHADNHRPREDSGAKRQRQVKTPPSESKSRRKTPSPHHRSKQRSSKGKEPMRRLSTDSEPIEISSGDDYQSESDMDEQPEKRHRNRIDDSSKRTSRRRRQS